MIVSTIYGDMDDSLLVRRDGQIENDHEITTCVEYWSGDEMVHRSVHVRLKQMPEMTAASGGW